MVRKSIMDESRAIGEANPSSPAANPTPPTLRYLLSLRLLVPLSIYVLYRCIMLYLDTILTYVFRLPSGRVKMVPCERAHASLPNTLGKRVDLTGAHVVFSGAVPER